MTGRMVWIFDSRVDRCTSSLVAGLEQATTYIYLTYLQSDTVILRSF